MDGLECSSDFQVLQYSYQAYGNRFKCASYYHNYSHVRQPFQFSGRVQVLVSFFAFFFFHAVVGWGGKVHDSVSSFFLLLSLIICCCWLGLGDFSFLHNSQWITLPTQLCLVLYSLCTGLLLLLLMWLIISSLSPHNLHLLFFCWLLLLLLLLLLLIWEFFTFSLADGLPLVFEWQQVSSSLQDSSQYSNWS